MMALPGGCYRLSQTICFGLNRAEQGYIRCIEDVGCHTVNMNGYNSKVVNKSDKRN